MPWLFIPNDKFYNSSKKKEKKSMATKYNQVLNTLDLSCDHVYKQFIPIICWLYLHVFSSIP